MTGSVLVLGGSGRFGRHASEAFWNAGWRVTQYDRARGDLTAAARGNDVIVNGWNPPYDRWADTVSALTAQVIAAARKSGATVIVPGNVYVFGEEAPALLGPTTPHTARNPLGRIRVDMEKAYRDSGVQTIILRAGDFIDTEPSGNWFDRIIAKDAGRGRFVYPGDPDQPHAWAFLPDLAETAVALAARRADLPRFSDIPFAGYTLTGRELAAACGRALGREVRLTRMSWLPIQLARPFWPMARRLAEMRYLWSMPHGLEPDTLAALLPNLRETPVETALSLALAGQIHPDEAMPRNGGAVPA